MTRLNNKGGGTTTKSRRGNDDDNNKNGKNSNNMILKMKIAFILLLIIQVITIITLKSSSTSTSTAVVCGQGLQSYSSSDLESLSFNSPPITRSSSSSSSSSSNSDYDDYELARTQSFGFFDDIPSKQWKILQNIHYESFPNYYTKSTTTIDSTKVNPHYNDPIILQQYSNTMYDKRNTKNQLKYSNWWNGENFQIEFHCPMMRRVPSTSQADGPKWVCDLHRLIDSSTSTSNDVSSNVDKSSNDSKSSKSKSSCLIFSFGSNGKSEFEQGIKDVTKDSCEIHTFDMETYNKRNVHFNESLKGISTFHSWGLGTIEQSNRHPQTYKTLQQTMDVLGHTNRTIDIFKIDCEWCEWTTYTQWIDNTTVVDIRQILVETHNAPLPNARDFFFQLHDTGYVIFSKEANYQNAGGGVEFGFLKLHTDFFLNNTMYNYQL